MFSSTTIALSTTTPVEKARPASEMTLSVRPVSSITSSVPMMQMGMASEMISVLLIERRKTSSTTMESSPPMRRSCSTRSMAERM
jgi:hypothetical protein